MKTTHLTLLLLLGLGACGAEETTIQETSPPDAEPAPTEQPPESVPPAEEPPMETPDPMDPPEEEPPETVFEECATQYDEAELEPLDMVIMLDRSGSMNDDGKWASVTAAIQQFAAHPDSDGIGVSLDYFPQPYSGTCAPCDGYCSLCYNGCCALPTGEWCWDDSDCGGAGVCFDFMCHAGGGNATCEIGDYTTPEVPLATLPAGAGALNISMAGHTPTGGTPTGPALQGAISYATTLAAQPNANETVVVLATDGEPTECQPQAIADVASVAAAATSAATPVPTFVVGVGANMFNLNVIAAAGGTNQAYLVDADATATQTFLDALNDIRRVAVACQYTIPEITGDIAYDLVNVAYTTGTQPLTPVSQVPTAADCGVAGGWHYDDPNAPTSIVICPTTCDQLQGADDTQIEIVYGCQTILR